MTITPGGWVFMVAAWAGIFGLASYCLFKVIFRGKDKHE